VGRYTGPGVSPGERDADDDDVALEDDTELTGPAKDRAPAPADAEADESSPNENRPATTSVAPDALDEGSSDD
jgi:hypothetical protein